jgi:hypothetical protein
LKPVISSDENGISHFSEVSLISNEAEYTYQAWTPGKVSIRLQSSAEDAWGQMPVLENMGGAYAKCDLEMKELFVVAKPDPVQVMPYLMMSRFDSNGIAREENSCQ